MGPPESSHGGGGGAGNGGGGEADVALVEVMQARKIATRLPQKGQWAMQLPDNLLTMACTSVR